MLLNIYDMWFIDTVATLIASSISPVKANVHVYLAMCHIVTDLANASC